MDGNNKADGGMKSDKEAKEKHIHCFAYMDKSGRILIPLRNRKEIGIGKIEGADVEVELVVKKVYEKKVDK